VKQRLLSILLACAALAPLASAATPKRPRFDLSRAEIRTFVAQIVKRDSLSRRRVLRLLANAEPQPKIIEAMNRPAEHVLEWWEYRALFVNDTRIAEGVEFWQAHRESLERVEAEHGVPAQYLVAILGCETRYGRITGHDRVLDSLATLAFDYPPRGEFFRAELEQFILLVRDEHLDPLTIKGSYAGAMGAPQFMPSTYRRYAVDASNDHKRDLWNNWDDVLASIANYLRQNGWQPGEPVLVDARLDPEADFQFDPGSLDLSATIEGLSAHGVRTELAIPGSTAVVLISAEQQDGPAYRIGFNNFRVITRYNRSARYAMAVNDLADSIAAHVHAGAAPSS
jgi:membrane-bound lytic murein transglycosylase B